MIATKKPKVATAAVEHDECTQLDPKQRRPVTLVKIYKLFKNTSTYLNYLKITFNMHLN